MEWTVLVSALLLFASIGWTSAQDPPCPDGYTSSADTCYKVFAKEVTSYTEAQTHCNSEGGHLAMAKDQATNRLLVHLINQESQDLTFYYFGLTFSEEENAWIWDDGSDLVFSNWRPTEPNRPDEHCTVFCWGQWCDAPCSSSREFEFTAGFICEVRGGLGDGQKVIFPDPRETYNFARLDTTLSDELPSFTLCVHMRSSYSSLSMTLASYAVPEQHNELLLFYSGGFLLFVQGSSTGIGNPPVWDDEWHVICVTWRSSDGAWQLYVDGVLTGRGSGLRAGGKVRTGGTWMIGQDQDAVGTPGRSTFNEQAGQAYIGELSKVNLWDGVLSSSEIGVNWAAFCNHNGNVIGWDMSFLGLSGQASMAEYYQCACNRKGTCSAWGDPHYTMFDGRRHHFQGPCRYTFAKDCVNGDFTVETQHKPVTNRRVSRTHEVYVIAFGIEIGILQDKVVIVDTGAGPTTTSLPYFEPGGRIAVEMVGRYVCVRLIDSCVYVYFDGTHRIRVDVPTTYMNKMCGLCGNFNSDASDDLNGQSWTVFGNTHLTDISTCPGGDIGPTDDPQIDCDPTLDATVRNDGNCGRIRDTSGPFAICHTIVDPSDFFEDCVFDMCAWEGADGLCQNLEAYADECAANGVPSINWRTADLCPLPCPANSVYNPCMTPCAPTCRDQSANCDGDCVEGCECIADHIWSGDSCVPVNQCGCTDTDTGVYYELNAQWGTSDGQLCQCDEGGIINCVPVNCNVDGGYAWMLVDGVWGCHCVGDCCDRVLCKASGDPHYCTADQRRHHFQGGCTYTFAKDCVGNDFTVETKNVPSPRRPSVSLVRAVWVYITIDDVTWVICILQGRVVRVNDETRTLPLSLAGGKIDVKLTGRFVRIELVDLCVVILYDGRHQVKVEIPRNYQDRLCGLCGNFNGDKTDDYMLPDGSTAPNWNVFGNAWQTDDPCDVDPPTGEPPTLGPCDPQYSDPCDVLTDTSGPFATCIPVVDPTPYVEDCVYDMCQTQTGICSILETYYDTCMEAGVPAFAWRSQDFCPMDCPANSHYSASASACPATCVNPNAPDNCNVFPEFGEGCVCDEGYRQSGQECVPDSQCGCIDVYENYYMIGEQWGTEDGQQCECGFPFGPDFPWITCTYATCNEEDGYSWTLVDGVWGCHCVLPCCDRAICYANGDPHYCTPDGRLYDFQGPCRYVFAKDCGNSSDFTVEVQQVPAPWNPTVSIVRQVFVIAYGYEIKIDQGGVVTVNPSPLSATNTFTQMSIDMGKIVITWSGMSVKVELTELCVVILYDGVHEIMVEIPSNYQNDLCGLCGNYNGMPGDDLMMPDGTVVTNLNTFGNSWVTDINTYVI
ncbi:zonadhesin-like [Branchiostoma floridae x Branchiostoma japonicum]